MTKPFFIGIAGESGVGKSTIASIIALYFGGDVLHISTDDLHKWERNNPMWDKYTHLNPSANNLELGDFHIRDLAEGRGIYRSVYNHDTGNFDPPVKMMPTKHIINEGLHAFYTELTNIYTDLKIFVDTDEELRVHWKLVRDTEQRGYKYNAVIDAINKRKADSVIIRERQMDNADVIIKLGTASKIKSPGSKNEDILLTVDLQFVNESYRSHPLFKFVNDFMVGLNEFIKLSNVVGNDLSLCQNAGGNVSVKVSESVMIVKSSGCELKDVHGLSGHSVVDYSIIRDALHSGCVKDDRHLNKLISESVTSKGHKRPSMETGFHTHLDKYVVHTHPIYVNVLLCMLDSKSLIKKVFDGLDYSYIEYKNPGFDLSMGVVLNGGNVVYFLENHGLIVSSDDYWTAINMSAALNETAKLYLENNSDFIQFSLDFADSEPERLFFYPDSAVFLDDDSISKKEVLAAHNYISKVGRSMGKLRYLSQDDVYFLQNMESEIYRKSL